jgi:hypothetical protein
MIDYNAIAESNNFIVLDKYSKKPKVSKGLPREIALRQKQYEITAIYYSPFPKRRHR